MLYKQTQWLPLQLISMCLPVYNYLLSVKRDRSEQQQAASAYECIIGPVLHTASFLFPSIIHTGPSTAWRFCSLAILGHTRGHTGLRLLLTQVVPWYLTLHLQHIYVIYLISSKQTTFCSIYECIFFNNGKCFSLLQYYLF
jgi:hypothetical protein